eukprot:3936769-Ditylum_brightwellii.AAC.1
MENAVKKAVKDAKESWAKQLAIDTMKYAHNPIKSWKTMRTLEKGLTHHHTQCWTICMPMEDRRKTKTDDKNTQVFAKNFNKFFNSQSPLPCDPTTLDLIDQLPDFLHLTDPISLSEVCAALWRMANGKAAGPCGITSDAL